MSDMEDGNLEFVQDSDNVGGGGFSGNFSGQSALAPSSQDELSPSLPQAAHPHLAIPSTAPEEVRPVGALPFSYAIQGLPLQLHIPPQWSPKQSDTSQSHRQ